MSKSQQTYFQGPLRTLQASLKNGKDDPRLALHDITEAYYVISVRLQNFVLQNVNIDTNAARTTFKQLKSHLIKALCRDIRRLLHDSPPREASIQDISQFFHSNESLTIAALNLTSDILRFGPDLVVFKRP